MVSESNALNLITSLVSFVRQWDIQTEISFQMEFEPMGIKSLRLNKLSFRNDNFEYYIAVYARMSK